MENYQWRERLLDAGKAAWATLGDDAEQTEIEQPKRKVGQRHPDGGVVRSLNKSSPRRSGCTRRFGDT